MNGNVAPFPKNEMTSSQSCFHEMKIHDIDRFFGSGNLGFLCAG